MSSCVDRYWARYRAKRPPGTAAPKRYVESFFFGTRPESAHEITALVLAGTKTATGSLLWAYQADGKPVPQPGDLWVVTNGGDDPACIIETTEVRTLPFDEVGADYARDGGEGDRTLASWRAMYWAYIESECARIGREASERTPLVMERFRVVYREPLHPGASAPA